MIDLRNKKLRRSPKDAILLGIASGVGHYLEVDPVFVRLVWLGLAALTKVWPMFVLYVILYFVMPIDPAQDTVASEQQPKDVTADHQKDEPSQESHPQNM